MYYVTNREVFLLFNFHLFGLEQSSARVHATVYLFTILKLLLYPTTGKMAHILQHQILSY